MFPPPPNSDNLFIAQAHSQVKNDAQPSIFKRLQGVWISDETLFRVFDMASQMINNSWRNSRLKLAKFDGN